MEDYFVLCIVKPLYNIAKVRNHWFAIYLDYHKKKLSMEILFYIACLLITKNKGENLNIARL